MDNKPKKIFLTLREIFDDFLEQEKTNENVDKSKIEKILNFDSYQGEPIYQKINDVSVGEKYAIVTSKTDHTSWGSQILGSNYQIFDIDKNMILFNSGIMQYGANHRIFPKSRDNDFDSISIIDENESSLTYEISMPHKILKYKYDIESNKKIILNEIDLEKQKKKQLLENMLEKEFIDFDEEDMSALFKENKASFKNYKIDNNTYFMINYFDGALVDYDYVKANAKLFIKDKGVIELEDFTNLPSNATSEDFLFINYAKIKPSNSISKDINDITFKYQLKMNYNYSRKPDVITDSRKLSYDLVKSKEMFNDLINKKLENEF